LIIEGWASIRATALAASRPVRSASGSLRKVGPGAFSSVSQPTLARPVLQLRAVDAQLLVVVEVVGDAVVVEQVQAFFIVSQLRMP
jgi:hypothetical protein